MSKQQIEVCAARLPEPHRTEFKKAMARAAALFKEGQKTRCEAWERYREITGRAKRGHSPKARRP
jgi:hypothetical protein